MINPNDEPRINDAITDEEVRLVDAEGNMLGVVNTSEAIIKATEAGLDLVEVAAQAKPPVCKILDYGKYRYEAQKKAKEAKKKQKIITVKEIKLRPSIEDHDYGVKMKNARKFIEGGDKVKFSLRFRGREMAHQEFGFELLKRVQEDMSDIAEVEVKPKHEGRQLMMILIPHKQA